MSFIGPLGALFLLDARGESLAQDCEAGATDRKGEMHREIFRSVLVLFTTLGDGPRQSPHPMPYLS